MRGEQPSTPGVSSRRSACDRCRGQKLRCLRASIDPDSRCDRCAKSNSECITSPIYHMRSYSVKVDAADTAPRKRQRSDGEAPAHQPKHPRPSVNEAASTPNFDWLPTDLIPASIDGSSLGGSTGLTSANWNSMDSSAIIVPGSAAIPVAINAWYPGEFSLEHIFSADNNVDDILPPLDSILAQGITTSSGPPPPGSVQPQNASSLPHNESLPEVSKDESLASPDQPTENNKASDGAQDYTEQLSKLNLDLTRQLRRITKGQTPMTLKTIIDSPRFVCGGSATTSTAPRETSPLEDMLNSTRLYLDILGLITGPLEDSSSASNAPVAARSHDGNAGATTGLSVSQDDDSSYLSGSSLASTPSTSPDGSETSADAAIILLTLTCYVHLLRLYVVLFAHILQYLQTIAESDKPVLSPLPGLYGFSNFPLQSGNLQSTVVIQLITSMFGKMETLLGMPREFCVGARKVGHDGLLGSEDFLTLAKTIMQKENEGPIEEGKGGVKSLRRDMKKAKRLLRDRIAL